MERVERVLRAARVVLAGAGGRQQAERVAPGVDEADADVLRRGTSLPPPSRAPRSRARRARRGRACPPARRDRVARRGRSRARDARGPRARAHVSRSCRLTRLRTTAFPTDFGTARPSRGSSVSPVLAREPVEDEEPRRGRAAAAIDGVEVPGTRQAVPALHVLRIDPRAQAESRLRPLALRRFRIACPARVDMRARKPCLRLRRRTLGW